MSAPKATFTELATKLDELKCRRKQLRKELKQAQQQQTQNEGKSISLLQSKLSQCFERRTELAEQVSAYEMTLNSWSRINERVKAKEAEVDRLQQASHLCGTPILAFDAAWKAYMVPDAWKKPEVETDLTKRIPTLVDQLKQRKEALEAWQKVQQECTEMKASIDFNQMKREQEEATKGLEEYKQVKEQEQRLTAQMNEHHLANTKLDALRDELDQVDDQTKAVQSEMERLFGNDDSDEDDVLPVSLGSSSSQFVSKFSRVGGKKMLKRPVLSTPPVSPRPTTTTVVIGDPLGSPARVIPRPAPTQSTAIVALSSSSSAAAAAAATQSEPQGSLIAIGMRTPTRQTVLTRFTPPTTKLDFTEEPSSDGNGTFSLAFSFSPVPPQMSRVFRTLSLQDSPVRQDQEMDMIEDLDREIWPQLEQNDAASTTNTVTIQPLPDSNPQDEQEAVEASGDEEESGSESELEDEEPPVTAKNNKAKRESPPRNAKKTIAETPQSQPKKGSTAAKTSSSSRSSADSQASVSTTQESGSGNNKKRNRESPLRSESAKKNKESAGESAKKRGRRPSSSNTVTKDSVSTKRKGRPSKAYDGVEISQDQISCAIKYRDYLLEAFPLELQLDRPTQKACIEAARDFLSNSKSKNPGKVLKCDRCEPEVFQLVDALFYRTTLHKSVKRMTKEITRRNTRLITMCRLVVSVAFEPKNRAKPNANPLHAYVLYDPVKEQFRAFNTLQILYKELDRVYDSEDHSGEEDYVNMALSRAEVLRQELDLTLYNVTAMEEEQAEVEKMLNEEEEDDDEDEDDEDDE